MLGAAPSRMDVRAVQPLELQIDSSPICKVLACKIPFFSKDVIYLLAFDTKCAILFKE